MSGNPWENAFPGTLCDIVERNALVGSLILSQPFAGAMLVSKISRCAAVSLAMLLASIRDVHGVAGVTGVLLGLMIPTQGIRLDPNEPLLKTETP